MIRCVVTIVSHATRASGSALRKASTTVSEIRSATLSGWPSETLSLVNTYELLATPLSEQIKGAVLRATWRVAQSAVCQLRLLDSLASSARVRTRSTTFRRTRWLLIDAKTDISCAPSGVAKASSM